MGRSVDTKAKLFRTNASIRGLCLAMCALMLILGAHNVALARTYFRLFSIKLSKKQFTDNILGNDVWMTDWLNVGLISLDFGERDELIVDIKFDQPLQLDDGFFDGNESVKFSVDGKGGGGGVNNRGVDYRFDFTDVKGGPLLVDPVIGNTSWDPVKGDVEFSLDINLISGGNVNFQDIHLTLINVHQSQIWSFDRVRVGVDADSVTPLFNIAAVSAANKMAVTWGNIRSY